MKRERTSKYGRVWGNSPNKTRSLRLKIAKGKFGKRNVKGYEAVLRRHLTKFARSMGVFSNQGRTSKYGRKWRTQTALERFREKREEEDGTRELRDKIARGKFGKRNVTQLKTELNRRLTQRK